MTDHTAPTVENVRDLMRDPRYWRDRDPSVIARVTEAFQRLFPADASAAVQPAPQPGVVEALRKIIDRLITYHKGFGDAYPDMWSCEVCLSEWVRHKDNPDAHDQDCPLRVAYAALTPTQAEQPTAADRAAFDQIVTAYQASERDAQAQQPTPSVPATETPERDMLRRLVVDVEDLISHSRGVYGLHLNGDGAPWGSLTKGGQFESWLGSLDEARDMLTFSPPPPAAAATPPREELAAEMEDLLLDEQDAALEGDLGKLEEAQARIEDLEANKRALGNAPAAAAEGWPKPRQSYGQVAGCPDDIRAAGWTVAVHNDYRLNGEPHTFWLFTRGGKAVKGEGRTDAAALLQVRQQLGIASPAPPAEGEG